MKTHVGLILSFLTLSQQKLTYSEDQFNQQEHSKPNLPLNQNLYVKDNNKPVMEILILHSTIAKFLHRVNGMGLYFLTVAKCSNFSVHQSTREIL